MAKKSWIAIGVIILVLVLINESPKIDFFGGKKLFSTLDDLNSRKAQLMQEYNPYWASQLDDAIQPNGCASCSQESKLFISDTGHTSTYSDQIVLNSYHSTETLRTKRNFYGQEVVILYESNGDGRIIIGDNIYPSPNQHQVNFIIIRPHTLDNTKVDLIENGLLAKTIAVTNPMSIGVSSGAGWSSSSDPHFDAHIYFIGSKAQYCDVAPDEVAIQESFASTFGINDLSFPPTKFCKDTRPFTLRDLQQGEAAISPNPIPSFNRGDNLTPTTNSIITVNYWTPNVAGVTQPCATGKANKLIGGKWVCDDFEQKANTTTRYITDREIITFPSSSTFTFSSNNYKSLKIGSKTLYVQEKLACAFPSGVDIIRPPEPQGCYKTKIDYGSSSFELNDKGTANLSDNLNVQFFAGGEYSPTANKLSGTYIFNVNNPLQIDTKGGISIQQNQSANIPLTLTNNIPSGNVVIRVQQKVKTTNEILPEKTITLNALNGKNDFSFGINTNNLGLNEISVQAFYEIDADAKILLTSDKIILSVDIQGDKPSIIQFVDRQVPVYIEKPSPVQIVTRMVNQTQSFFDSIPLYAKVIGGIFIFIFILRLF